MIAQMNAGGFEAQKNLRRFQGLEECREICGIRRMQEGMRAKKNAG